MSGQRALIAVLIAGLLLVDVAVSATTVELHKQCQDRFAPRKAEPGKDVLWLPTLDEVVKSMLEAAEVTSRDYVIDLGSGDGKIPIAAAKQFGATALGIEYNAQLVQLARCHVRVEGLGERVQIEQGDIFETDFSEATVVTLYLLTELNLKLRPAILKMKPGTRVVSNTFQMGEWRPDQYIDPPMGNTQAYLWVVPAAVQGTWQVREEGGADRFELVIKQRFQDLSAAAPQGAGLSIFEPRLRGGEIEFRIGGPDREAMTLKGQVHGEHMDLTAHRAGKLVKYTAKRVHSEG